MSIKCKKINDLETRNKPVVPKELTEGWAEHERAYLERLVSSCIHWKLVTSVDDWYPSWTGGKVLVTLDIHWETMSKPKRARLYYIFATGLDDDLRESHNLIWTEAKRIFDTISEGISKERMHELGLHW